MLLFDHRRNDDEIAHDKEARRLQANDERLLRARGRVGDAELISRRSRARRGLPARERIGIFHLHRRLAVLVRDQSGCQRIVERKSDRTCTAGSSPPGGCIRHFGSQLGLT